jgi:hypothetical protein
MKWVGGSRRDVVLMRSTRSIRLRSATCCYRNYILDSVLECAYIEAVPLTEGVSGDEPESERGCGVLRARLVTALPGGSGNPPSATMSGREELADGELGRQQCLMISPRAGPAANKSPRWSAERRASPGCADCES